MQLLVAASAQPAGLSVLRECRSNVLRNPLLRWNSFADTEAMEGSFQWKEALEGG